MLCPEDKMLVAWVVLAVCLCSGARGQGVQYAGGRRDVAPSPGGQTREGAPHYRGPRPPRNSVGGKDESWMDKIFSFVSPKSSG